MSRSAWLLATPELASAREQHRAAQATATGLQQKVAELEKQLQVQAKAADAAGKREGDLRAELSSIQQRLRSANAELASARAPTSARATRSTRCASLCCCASRCCNVNLESRRGLASLHCMVPHHCCTESRCSLVL